MWERKVIVILLIVIVVLGVLWIVGYRPWERPGTSPSPSTTPPPEISSTPSGPNFSTPPPASAFSVRLNVTMPYSKAEFMDVQYNYRSALASASGTTADDVDIIAVTEQVSRRNDDASGASVSASWEMLAQAKEGASSSMQSLRAAVGGLKERAFSSGEGVLAQASTSQLGGIRDLRQGSSVKVETQVCANSREKGK